jgi:ethanolamine kinase
LGNHFNEFTGFDLDFSRYPDTATQIHFIEEYLCSFYECEKSALSAKEIEHVHREANQWSLVSHFLWSVWALFQASYSTIDFDFVAFSNRRFEFYFRNRDKFLSPKTKDFVYE